MKLPSEMTNNNKIFELLRDLQKEVEDFRNKSILLVFIDDKCSNNFCNIIDQYINEIRLVLNGEENETKGLSIAKEMLNNNIPIPELKRCIMCDKILSNQKDSYPTNHYLCGSECTQYYLSLSKWSKKDKIFILNEDMLNNFRELHGINPIDDIEIGKRIDNKDRKEIFKIFGVDEDES